MDCVIYLLDEYECECEYDYKFLTSIVDNDDIIDIVLKCRTGKDLKANKRQIRFHFIRNKKNSLQ